MTALVYQDFDLSIELSSSAPIRYRALSSSLAAGEASTEFTLPFSAQELEILFLRLGRPRRSVRAIGSPEMREAQAFGSQLFATVFTGQVQSALVSSLSMARQQGQGLRIRLRLSDVPELADLPWEFLYDPDHHHFLAYSTVTPLIRYLDLPSTVAPLAVQPPLKILVMIANPRDYGYSTLDVEDEWRKVQVALADLQSRGLVQVTRLEAGTLSALQRQLRRDQYHIFHFIGHGGFDQQSQSGELLLEDEQGRSRMVSGYYLGALLRDHFSLRLALLNACEGARTSRTDPFAGVAQHLVQQGIPAVIAMQFEITDQAAITLAHEFYSALADNYGVDAALSEARKALYAAGNDIEWGTPVLYLRVQRGELFDLSVQPSTPPGATSPPMRPVEPQPAPQLESAISNPAPQAPDPIEIEPQQSSQVEQSPAQPDAEPTLANQSENASVDPAPQVPDSIEVEQQQSSQVEQSLAQPDAEPLLANHSENASGDPAPQAPVTIEVEQQQPSQVEKPPAQPDAEPLLANQLQDARIRLLSVLSTTQSSRKGNSLLLVDPAPQAPATIEVEHQQSSQMGPPAQPDAEPPLTTQSKATSTIVPSTLVATQQVQPVVDNAVRRRPKHRRAGSKTAAPTKLPLSAWNPLDYLKLLWWLFITPHQLRTYRTKDGSIDSRPLQPLGGYLASILTWLPLLLPSVALWLDLLPRPVDAWPATVYGWISLCLIGVVALGGWLGKYDDNVAFAVAWLVAYLVTTFVVVGVTVGMAVVVTVGVALGVAVRVAVGVTVGVAIGVVGGVAFGVAVVVAGVVTGDVTGGVAGFVTTYVTTFVTGGVAGGVAVFVGDLVKKGAASWLSYGCFGGLVLAYGFLIWYCYLGGYQWFV